MPIFPEMDPNDVTAQGLAPPPMVQPEAPAVMPQPAPQMMPAQMMPASPIGGQFYNPMADHVPSVMQDPALQAKLKQAYHQQLDDFIHTNKGDSAGKLGQLFTGLSAVGLGAFGGAAGGMAATDLVRQAHADANAAKSRTEAHAQSSIMALRHLADIEATTGLKPWSQAMKDFRQAQGQGIKDKGLDIQQQKADDAKTYHDGLLKAKESFRSTYQNLKQDDQKLKAMGINFNYDKLQQAHDVADMQDKRMRDIATIQAKVRKGIADQSDITARAKLLHAYQHDNAWLGMETQKHNDYLEKLSNERDPLTGKPKYDDGKGNPVDFRKYKTDYTPMQPGEQAAPDPQDLAGALDLLHQGGQLPAAPQSPFGQEPMPQGAPQQPGMPPQQTQPQAQPQQAPAAMPNSSVMKSGFAAIAKAKGLKPEDAKRLFIDAAMKRGIPYAQAVQMLGAQ